VLPNNSNASDLTLGHKSYTGGWTTTIFYRHKTMANTPPLARERERERESYIIKMTYIFIQQYRADTERSTEFMTNYYERRDYSNYTEKKSPNSPTKPRKDCLFNRSVGGGGGAYCARGILVRRQSCQ